MKNESIILIGMAGAGKSAIGKLLSGILKIDFIDLDIYISDKNHATLQKIIDEKGEQAFLELEKQTMRGLDLRNKIIAPGGSIIYHPGLMEYLKQHSTLIYLDDSFENIEKRLADAPKRGIVGLKNKTLREIYNERLPLYRRYADIIVDCREKSKDRIVGEISLILKK